MAWNIADLIEHAVDAVPDRVALIVGDRDARPTRSSRSACQPARAPPCRPRASGPATTSASTGSTASSSSRRSSRPTSSAPVPINVNYRYVEDELRYLFDNADLVALVHDAQFAPRIAAVRESLPLLRHLIAIDDGSGADCSALGSVAYDDALAGGVARARLRASVATTTSTSSTPAAPPACPRASCGGRRTCSACSAAASTSTPASRSPTNGSSPTPRPRSTDEGRGIVIAPLMHGAAQWGTLGSLFNGNTLVLMPKFDADEVWQAVEQHRITALEHHRRRDGPPADRGARGRRLRRVVARRRSRRPRRSSRATVKDQFLERFPNLIIADAVGSTETGYNGMRRDREGRPSASRACPTVRMGPDTVVLDDD